MYKRRRFSSYGYHPYPVSRARVVRRASSGYAACLIQFLLDVLTGIVLVILALVFVFVLLVLLTHLHQVEALCAQAQTFVTRYGPLTLLVVLLVAGSFLVLSLVSALVKILAAISETLSHASLMHARAQRERMKRAHYQMASAPTVPLTRLRLRRPGALGRWT